jgi:hypothetical protein
MCKIRVLCVSKGSSNIVLILIKVLNKAMAPHLNFFAYFLIKCILIYCSILKKIMFYPLGDIY